MQIRRVFLEQWDPISAADSPYGQDEYDMCLGEMYDLLERNASETELVDYLYEIEREVYGIAVDKARLLPAAQTLRSLNISHPSGT